MRDFKLLNALKKHGIKVKKVSKKGLMFVDATLSEKAANSVMIDTSATHNFVFEVETCHLQLKFDKDVGCMKAALKGLGNY